MTEIAYNGVCPTPGAAVVSTHSPADLSAKKKYVTILYNLGIAEFALGVASCGICLITILFAAERIETDYDDLFYLFDRMTTYVAPGLWCGVFLFICGALGVNTRRKPTVGVYNASMAMCIITAVLMALLAVLSLRSSLLCFRLSSITPELGPAHGSLAIGAFAAMIVCIVHAAYCCSAVCGGGDDTDEVPLSQDAAEMGRSQPPAYAQAQAQAQPPVSHGYPAAYGYPNLVPGARIVVQTQAARPRRSPWRYLRLGLMAGRLLR